MARAGAIAEEAAFREIHFGARKILLCMTRPILESRAANRLKTRKYLYHASASQQTSVGINGN